MPRLCSICAHPQTAEIAKALANGDSFRAIASRFNVTAASAQRHLSGCLRTRRTALKSELKAEPSPPLPTFDCSDPSSLIATTARLVNEALDLLEHAKTAGDRRTALAALREARESLAVLMRVIGMLQGDGAVVDQRSQTIQILANVTDDDLRAIVAAGRQALPQ